MTLRLNSLFAPQTYQMIGKSHSIRILEIVNVADTQAFSTSISGVDHNTTDTNGRTVRR